MKASKSHPRSSEQSHFYRPRRRALARSPEPSPNPTHLTDLHHLLAPFPLTTARPARLQSADSYPRLPCGRHRRSGNGLQSQRASSGWKPSQCECERREKACGEMARGDTRRDLSRYACFYGGAFPRSPTHEELGVVRGLSPKALCVCVTGRGGTSSVCELRLRFLERGVEGRK